MQTQFGIEKVDILPAPVGASSCISSNSTTCVITCVEAPWHDKQGHGKILDMMGFAANFASIAVCPFTIPWHVSRDYSAQTKLQYSLVLVRGCLRTLPKRKTPL